ncbi:MAG: dihydroorotase [Bacteroidetes bacterium]|nr:MAG: dihydroorotase [Bacteroidota bacterium]TAG86540.1 MAG: dihydroorotase [Bacteroidota bacterium]
MSFLFKNIEIIDKNSIYHQKKVHLYIDNQHIISEIYEVNQNPILPENTIIKDFSDVCVSIGWVDMYAQLGEPGFEHKETLQTGSKSALKGGFTSVCVMPNTNPIIQSKNEIQFIKNFSYQNSHIDLLPIASVTVDNLGKDLTEMIDLHYAGAIAFSDGDKTIENSDMLRKILLYLQKIDGLLMQKAEDVYLAKFGQMNEGETSTILGLKGIPNLSEEIIIQRDLKILAYTKGKIHFHLISTAESVALIRQAKKQGLDVSCSVAAHQIAFTDKDLIDFDTYLKVNPPFRTEKDKLALLEGLADDTIDVLVSAHTPQDVESKLLEFDMADFGAIGLETSFAVSNTFSMLSLPHLIDKLTNIPRKILQLPALKIEIGEKANLTFFNPHQKWIVKKEDICSKSFNSPFLNQELNGKVIGIYKNGWIE